MTAVLLVPVTVALNCWVCDARNVMLARLIAMPTVGCKLTVAVAVLLESVALVAMTLMFCDDEIEAGAA